MALVVGFTLAAGCGGGGGDDTAGGGSTSSATAPTTTEVTAAPRLDGAPRGGIPPRTGATGGELGAYTTEHEVDFEWYAGEGGFVAVVRGLDLAELPPLCLLVSYTGQAFTPFVGETSVPTEPGACDGAPGTVAESPETCLDLLVIQTPIPVASEGRLFGNIDVYEDGRPVEQTGGLASLDGTPPAFDPGYFGC